MAQCWLSRSISCLLAVVIYFSAAYADNHTTENASARARRIRASISEDKQFSVSKLSSDLTEGLIKQQGRIAIFEFVRDFEYLINTWRPHNPEDLLTFQYGDCRHKADLLGALFEHAGYEIRPVKVVFDLADLPIPLDILKIRGITKSLHNATEVYINNKWVYIDATWNKDLKRLGFPVTEDWDGINPTMAVTNGMVRIIQEFDDQDIATSYEEHHIPWPFPPKNKRFVHAFNKWLRANR